MVVTDLGEYEKVAGVYWPLAITSGRKGNRDPAKIHYDTIEVNIPTRCGLFLIPSPRQELRARHDAQDTLPLRPCCPLPPSLADDAAPVFDSGALSGPRRAQHRLGHDERPHLARSPRRQPDGKTTIFVGAASGGVWKSLDGGTTFKPVFDKQPVQSIGAIAIDPRNPETVWVGTGEAWMRNSVSIGDGIYKSTDGGDTWTNMGLPESERIVRSSSIRRTATVYACVPGRLWSDCAERGVYKTTDGGTTWTLVLKGANLSTGCSGLAWTRRTRTSSSRGCGTSGARAGRSARAATAQRAERQRPLRDARRRQDLDRAHARGERVFPPSPLGASRWSSRLGSEARLRARRVDRTRSLRLRTAAGPGRRATRAR